MTTDILSGVKVLEVAALTFVPAAGAVLAEWGADVIKVEHVQRGDAMRGLAASGIAVVPKDVHVLLEHSNRGKRSIGLDLTTPDGLDILHKLAATADALPPPGTGAEDASSPTNASTVRSRKRTGAG